MSLISADIGVLSSLTKTSTHMHLSAHDQASTSNKNAKIPQQTTVRACRCQVCISQSIGELVIRIVDTSDPPNRISFAGS
jgi:hypothetical protein